MNASGSFDKEPFSAYVGALGCVVSALEEKGVIGRDCLE
jgi:hypothetical protein